MPCSDCLVDGCMCEPLEPCSCVHCQEEFYRELDAQPSLLRADYAHLEARVVVHTMAKDTTERENMLLRLEQDPGYAQQLFEEFRNTCEEAKRNDAQVPATGECLQTASGRQSSDDRGAKGGASQHPYKGRS